MHHYNLVCIRLAPSRNSRAGEAADTGIHTDDARHQLGMTMTMYIFRPLNFDRFDLQVK